MKRADRRKFHYLYKITRLKDGKYYIGIHSTDDMNDGYFGSGKRIKRSLNCYGTEGHVKEILEVFPSRIEVIERERVVVNEEMLADPLCLNIQKGGAGVYPLERKEYAVKRKYSKKRVPATEETKQKIREKQLGKKASDETREKMRQSRIGKNRGPMSEETKRRISEGMRRSAVV